ncbi:MAG: SDR family oxidoreductase [Phycisphaerales bacterium]|nr:SDR family oxidoreductase [Planctomycetota bacterium]
MTEPAKTVILTGAGSGIGLATARKLHAAGFRLLLAGRDSRKLDAAAGELPGSLTRTVDLADSRQVEGLIDEGSAALGRLDVLVNNAGWTPLKPVGAHASDEIEQVFRVNAIAPCVAIARAFGIMQRQGGGCIVNVSSMATVDPFPGFFAYAAAKASLNLMVKSVANEGRSKGIRAYAVAPGAVETPLLRSMFSEKSIPRNRALHPDDVAQIIADCALGRREKDNGSTILVPSP